MHVGQQGGWVRRAQRLAALTLAGLLLTGVAGEGCQARAAPVAGTTAHAYRTAPPSVWPSSAAAARREAAAWLNLLPPYPNAVLVTPRPYLVLRVTPLGFPLKDGRAPVAPGVGVPGSPYLVDLYRVWRVRAPMTAVAAWAIRQAVALRLRSVASSSGSGPLPTDSTTGLAFGTVPGSLTPGIQVSLRYVQARETLVRYDAMVIWTPPRPEGERVPPGALAVTVAVERGVPPRVAAVRSVTERSTIVWLRRLANRLPRDTRGAHSCPADTGNAITLTFVYASRPGASRRGVTLREGTCDAVTFGPAGRYPVLTDPGFRLWNAVAALAGMPAMEQPGPPSPR